MSAREFDGCRGCVCKTCQVSYKHGTRQLCDRCAGCDQVYKVLSYCEKAEPYPEKEVFTR
jgi:hypothetical protein